MRSGTARVFYTRVLILLVQIPVIRTNIKLTLLILKRLRETRYKTLEVQKELYLSIEIQI